MKAEMKVLTGVGVVALIVAVVLGGVCWLVV